MFKKEIKFIYDFNVNEVKKLGNFITYEQLLSANIHPAIMQYISADIEYLIFEDRQKILRNSIFDYSGEKIRQYFSLIGDEIKRNKRFSLDYMSKLILHASSFTVNYLARPKWALAKFIFDDEQHKNTTEIKQILNYLYYYGYIRRVVVSYINKKKILSLNEAEFEDLLNRIDQHTVDSNEREIVESSLKSMADFFNIGDSQRRSFIPLKAVENFLSEKNLEEHLTKLKSTFEDEEKKVSLTEYLKVLGEVMYKSYEPVIEETSESFADEIDEEIPIEEEVEEQEVLDDEIEQEEEKTEDEEEYAEEDEFIEDEGFEVISKHEEETPIPDDVLEDESDELNEESEEKKEPEEEITVDEEENYKEETNLEEDVVPEEEVSFDEEDIPNDTDTVEDELSKSSVIPENFDELAKDREGIFEVDADIERELPDVVEENEAALDIKDELDELDDEELLDEPEEEITEIMDELEIPEEAKENKEDLDLFTTNDEVEEVEEKDQSDTLDLEEFLNDHTVKEDISEEEEDSGNEEKSLSEELDELEVETIEDDKDSEIIDDFTEDENESELPLVEDEPDDEEVEDLELLDEIPDNGELEEDETDEDDDEEAEDVQSISDRDDSLDVSSLLENKDLSYVIENVFDYDIEDFAYALEMACRAGSVEQGNAVLESIFKNNQADFNTKEAEVLKKVIKEYYEKNG